MSELPVVERHDAMLLQPADCQGSVWGAGCDFKEEVIFLFLMLFQLTKTNNLFYSSILAKAGGQFKGMKQFQ